jgi:hypothetical protein
VPNLRSAEVTNQSISLVASDGRTFSVTKAEIQAFLATQGGNAAARKAATITWVKANIQTALGAEQCPVGLTTFDFSVTDNAAAMLLEMLSG